MKTKIQATIYAIRCFLNGKRKLTHKLSPVEAHTFGCVALHLAEYLTREYKLDGAPVAEKGTAGINKKAARHLLKISKDGGRKCVYCGCADARACPGGCEWLIVHPATLTGVCSRCYDLFSQDYSAAAHAPFLQTPITQTIKKI